MAELRTEAPPRIAAWLVTLLMPSSRAELVLGDMDEDFAEATSSVGARAARKKYWSAAFLSILHGGRWRRVPVPADAISARRTNPGEIIMEIKLAMRALRRRPVYAFVTIATLAVAIGATVSVLSIVNKVLVQPLPYDNPEEIVTIWRTDPSRRPDPEYENSWNRIGMSLEEIGALKAKSSVFRGVAGFRTERRVVTAAGEPAEHVVAQTTPSLFPLLGIRPTLGRVFSATPQDAETVVLSDALWQTAFARDPRVIGSTIHLNGKPHTVIGVMPPSMGIQALSPFIEHGWPAVWVSAGGRPDDARYRDFETIARVADPSALPSVMQVAAAVIGREEGSRKVGAALELRQDAETASLRRPLFLLLLSAGLFLLLASLNVGTLALAEGEGRQKEMATRIALGGTRTQVARYFMLESALIATAGTIAGVLLAKASLRSLLAISPITLPPGVEGGLDLSMLPFIAALMLLVLFMSGSVPAWMAWRRAARGGMSGSSRGVTANGSVVRKALIAGQFALATILLVTSALLTRSLFTESNTPPGFAIENRVAIQIRRTPGTGGASSALISQRLASIPGVTSVGVTRRVPLRDRPMGWQVWQLDKPKQAPVAISLEPVSDGYFRTMGIPIVAGRPIEARDIAGSTPALVVSRKLADRLWPGLDPIGRKLTDPFVTYTVVGVADNVRDEGLDVAPEGIMYPAIAQTILPGDDAFILQLNGPRDEILKTARQIIRDLAPGAAIRAVVSFDEIIADILAADRYRATLSLLFAVLATFLAAIGLSALVLREVGSRMKEFAIRFSLGATRAAIVRLPLGNAVQGVLVGALLGAAGSVAVGRLLSSYLYGIKGGDPLTLALMIPVLSAVVLSTLLIALRRTPERDLIANLNA